MRLILGRTKEKLSVAQPSELIVLWQVTTLGLGYVVIGLYTSMSIYIYAICRRTCIQSDIM